ncbi:hypothetical protein QBC39DRAFT_407889 [Podospora conica]|nr:hypothetical protein QBC39DRAFT_407889 [Schizothecium conicum]
MNPFRAWRRTENDWFPVGLTSSFPDLDDTTALSSPRPCTGLPAPTPGCKAFHVPKDDPSKRQEVPIAEDAPASDTGADLDLDLTDQVLVFRYRGKVHAIDHQCPHSSFPLSKGAPFDIEDFGIVLSAGVTCPKHGWSFDLFSGRSDRGNYRLKVWEVELREVGGGQVVKGAVGEGEGAEEVVREVWVRRKPRMG